MAVTLAAAACGGPSVDVSEVERIGAEQARSLAKTDRGSREVVGFVPDHAAAVEECLALLCDRQIGVMRTASELSAIGFKAVHAEGLTGTHRVTPEVLSAMEAYNAVCPAHNPPYVKAMRLLAERFPRSEMFSWTEAPQGDCEKNHEVVPEHVELAPKLAEEAAPAARSATATISSSVSRQVGQESTCRVRRS